MEYPTLFTAGTQWWISPRVTRQTPEEVVVHEAGHQFWVRHLGQQRIRACLDGRGHQRVQHGSRDGYRLSHRRASTATTSAVSCHGRLRTCTSRDTDLNDLLAVPDGRATGHARNTPSFRQRPETVFVFAYDKPAVWLNTLERWLGWPVL